MNPVLLYQIIRLQGVYAPCANSISVSLNHPLPFYPWIYNNFSENSSNILKIIDAKVRVVRHNTFFNYVCTLSIQTRYLPRNFMNSHFRWRTDEYFLVIIKLGTRWIQQRLDFPNMPKRKQHENYQNLQLQLETLFFAMIHFVHWRCPVKLAHFLN